VLCLENINRFRHKYFAFVVISNWSLSELIINPEHIDFSFKYWHFYGLSDIQKSVPVFGLV